MKIHNGLLVAAAVVIWGVSAAPAFAKTVKDCTAEWRADKAGMQARGTTEKEYVEQCRSGAEPTTAAAPVAKPAGMAPPATPRQATAAGSKTAKECTAEWRADKAGMQARGVTEKAYVEQCRGGVPPVSASPTEPTAATAPAPAAPSPGTTSSSQKTAKDCIVEWRADKAGMQARGVTEKAYVEQCRVGGVRPAAAAPEPKPAAAAPAPSSSRPAPAATEAAPAPPSQTPSRQTTAAPVPAPGRQPSAPKGSESATLEPGQFADEPSAKARCPADTVVWVNLPSKIYHFVGTKSYGTTKRGAYMCEKDAIAAEDRPSKTETHP
jgi:hypothetical protein